MHCAPSSLVKSLYRRNANYGLGVEFVCACLCLCVWCVCMCVSDTTNLCATSRKFVGSIPDGVTGIFHWHNPSGRTMVLWLTKPLTEMRTGIIPGGKGGRCVGLTTLPLSCPECLIIWEPQPPGTLRVCQGLQLVCFSFTFYHFPKSKEFQQNAR
jgi:hypothetical protein